jgi:hypothetical protein
VPEISPPRIDSISDPNRRSQDEPAKKPRIKPSPPEKPAPLHAPEVSHTPEEEDKHELDEMA